MTALDMDWSAELDRIARAQPGRTPLTPEPALVEAFAEDRHLLPLCEDCARPMRRSGAKLADWPGTVQQTSSTRCSTCHGRWRAANPDPLAPTIRPCPVCDRTTRPRPILVADAPGTVPRVASGLCDTCHRRTHVP